jgi:ribosomal protein L18E
MGIDLKAGGRRVGHKSSMRVVKTQNPYNRLLIKLYKFLSRRTDSKFCATVCKRLHMSKVNQPPLGLARLSKYMTNKDGKTAVIVGKVTDDVRLMECPKLSVCALGFVLPRDPTRFSSVVPSLARLFPTLDTALRSATPTPTMVSSHTSDPRDASSSAHAVVVRLVVSRSKFLLVCLSRMSRQACLSLGSSNSIVTRKFALEKKPRSVNSLAYEEVLGWSCR